MKRLSFILLAGSALLGALPSVVTAQTAAPAADSGQIEEIIVTAERRAESEQSVPIAITALTPADLQNLGVSATQDLPLAAPAVTFTTSIGGASVTIRGVSGTGSGSDELASGIYLDGVYLAAPTSAVFFLSDIERIEVLEGPQGTLFGRNSSGGAIQIITHQPGEQTEGQVSFGYGNYGTTTTSDYVSGKIADGLFAGASVYYQNQNSGWGENIFNGSQAFYGSDLSVRGKLRWTPDEYTDITLALMHNEEQNPANQGNAEFPGVYTIGPTKTTNVGFYNVDNNIDQNTRNREDNAALTITRDFDDIVRLLSISSSDHVQLYGFLDNGAGPSPSVDLYIQNAPTVTFTQELQLQSEPGSWAKWVVGGFYYNNRVGFSPLYINNLVTVSSRANTDSFAGFAQVTIPIIASSTHFTAGLRYTDDIRSFHAIETVGGHELPAFTPEGISNKLLTWHLVLDHQFTPNVLGYVSDSRGGKSGFYNIASPTAPPTNPQVVLTYEAGLKTEFFDRHLRVNGDAFYNFFSEIQVESLLNGLPQYLNAAAAHIKGAEVTVTAKPIEHLTFQGGYTYLDGQYTSFPNAEFFNVNPPAKGGDSLYFANAAGKATVNTPRNVFTASVTYDGSTPQGIFSLSPTYYHNSGFWWDPQNSVPQPSYSLVGMVLGWTAPHSGWYGQLYGKNLNGARYLEYVQIGTGGEAYNPAPPRTYGVTVGYRFQ